MPYVSRPTPEIKSAEELSRWIREELNHLTLALSESTELELRPRSSAPPKPREGMIVYADGTWNPGNGAGPYVYKSGAWVSLVPDTLFSSGVWTPSVTFITPGDLSVAYGTRFGQYIKVGRLVIISFSVVTSTFTFTTASGSLTITGFPFATSDLSAVGTGIQRGPVVFGGLTLGAGYTQVVFTPTDNSTVGNFRKSGSGVGAVNVASTDCVSGTNVDLRSTVAYQTG